MESICAYAILWKCGFITQEEYGSFLDEAFIADPDSSLLLLLEERSTDSDKTYEIIDNLLHDNAFWPDLDKVGDKIRGYIGGIYKSDSLTVEEFGHRCYELWNALPDELRQKEPFFILQYADDYISFGEYETARQRYANAFCTLK